MPLRDTSPERLLVAIWDRDRRQLRRLLAQGASANAVDQDGRAPLMHAVFENDPALVALLLESDADVHHRDKGGWTALHYAAAARSPEVVTLLLEAGAEPNAKDDKGSTPLIDAVCGLTSGRAETVRVLLRHGASPTLKNAYGHSARSIARLAERKDLRRLLGPGQRSKRRPTRTPKGERAPARPRSPEPPVIARRSFELTSDRGTRRVEVALAKPARDGHNWFCTVLITGLSPGRMRLPIYGMDSMQALILALQTAGVYARTSGVELRWLGQRHLGLPPMPRRRKSKG